MFKRICIADYTMQLKHQLDYINLYKENLSFFRMEIRFEKLDFAYLSLNDSEGVEEDQELEFPKRSLQGDLENGVNYCPVSLPAPFTVGQLYFVRRGETYFSLFELQTDKLSIFNGLSEKLKKEINKGLSEWSQTSEDCCGYILKNKEPYISIVPINEKGVQGRNICVGSCGSKPIELSSIEDFILDVKNLEKIVNQVINSCLSAITDSKLISQIPKHPIYITP